jgi:hypothetical protein
MNAAGPHSLFLRGACSALIANAVLLASAQAAEIDLSLNAGAIYSDNVQRTQTDQTTDTIANAGVQFGVRQEHGDLRALVAADVQYRNYLQHTYDDEMIGGLSGTASYSFIPERFTWTVTDNFGQTFIDPRQFETPDNRQNTNYFTTGPDLRLPIGTRTSLALSGRWSSAKYEITDADNDRVNGTFGLVRQLGRTSALSFNVAAERVKYNGDGVLESEFRSKSAYLGFEAQGAHTDMSAQAGYTQLDYFGQKPGGLLLGLTATRHLSPRSDFTINLGTNFTDTAENFRRDQRIDGVLLGNEDAIVSSDPFRSDYATLLWDLNGSRDTIGMSLDWRRENHRTQDVLNRDAVAATLTLSRRLGPTVTGNIGGTWRRDEFDVGDLTLDEWSAGGGFDWLLARGYGIRLRGDHIVGRGDGPGGIGVRDFTENRVTLSVTFTPRR